MTRNDFVAIANIIASIDNGPARVDLAYHFADHLAKTNPRFDRTKFISHACLIQNGDAPIQKSLRAPNL